MAAGLFFRFYHLDWKIYGNDEATTSLRVAGYTLSDYGRVFDGRVRTSSELSRFQHVTSERNAADTIRSLATEDPQHPPLYYLFERGWVETFGNSVAARRSLSAIIGILVPLGAFWLCLELGSATAGVAMLVLVSVSPFHLLYSQTAREYELWSLCILISSALLIRAGRGDTQGAWLAYAISVVFGLYTDVLFLYVLCAHAVYIAVQQRGQPRRLLVPFSIALLCAFVAYVPWLYALLARTDMLANNSYLATPLPLALFAIKWIFNAGAVFFDLEYKAIASAIVLLPIFALVIWAAVRIARDAPRHVVLFIATLALIPAIAFVVPDLIQHESRSTAARYLVPAWLGLELAVSFALGSGSRVAAGALAFLAMCGVASNAVSSQAVSWWADGPGAIAPIATIINAADAPLVIFAQDPQRWDFSPVMLTNRVRPSTRFQLVAAGAPLVPASNRGTIFLLDPTAEQRADLARRHFVLTPMYLDTGTANADIAKMRGEASAARAKAGITEMRSSLWKLSTSATHT